MSILLQDVAHAIRGFRRRPGILISAVLTLAVGIGANVTVFSIVDALLLRPLPFGDRSDRVVTLHSTHRLQAENPNDSPLSYPDLVDLQRQTSSLENIGGFFERNFTVTTEADAERLLGLSVTPDVFPMLGVEPMLGRTFTADDGTAPGLEASVVLGHSLWIRRFGGDPGIIGRTVVINDRARTVVGVMPPRFKFPERSELFMPLRWDESPRSARNIAAIGVLKAGVSIEQAQEELRTVASRLESIYPQSNRGYGIRVLSFRDSQVNRETRLIAGTLMAAVAFVLMIACANLANLLLVRGAAQQREMAVRAAMGASRARLAGVLLGESAVLALCGATIGTLGAAWSLDFIRASIPEELPYWIRLDVDVRILSFTLAVTVVTTLVIGLLPALRASRSRIVEDLKEGERGATLGRTAQRLQTALTVAQVALCLALLVGANLMIRSFLSLQRADIGFDDSPILTLRVFLPGDAFDDSRVRAAFFDRAVQALRALPGVTAVAATTSIPGDDGGNTVRIVTDERSTLGDEIGVQIIATTPDLLGALGLPLLQGRAFTDAEALDPDARVTVINARLARRLWSDGSAVGRRVGVVTDADVTWLRVVGVSPDLLYEEPGEQTEQSRLNLHVPYAFTAPRGMALLLRSTGNPGSLVGPTRAALRRVFSALPIFDLRTMAEVRRFTTWEQQFFGTMMGAFAGTALLLACLGVYALLAYAARRRTHEIGVRMALGAQPRDVVSLLVGHAGRIGALGLAIGLVLAFGIARLLSGQIFEVDAFDPWIFVTTGASLLVAVLAAAYLPARRAARLDPTIALRVD